jgi:flap endonuclease-1
MGIQYLNTYIKKNTTSDSTTKLTFAELSNKVVAIDTSIYLYKFVSNNTLLESIYVMITLFKHYNIIPIFVFDGVPPKEKETIIKKRQNDKLIAKQKYEELQEQLNITTSISEQTNLNETINSLKKKCIKLKKTDFLKVRNLINAFGVYYIDAIGEADELCAKLVISKIAYACLSEDMDLFLYGCPRVLRYLSLTNSTVIIYYLDKILEDLNMNFKEFKEICVISGSDYITNNTFNFYTVLKYYKEYKECKEYKKCNDQQEFYMWLYNNHNIDKTIDLKELYNAYFMYQVSSNKLKIDISEFNKTIDHNKIKEIMTPEGFIFIE